jgi:hypothetical protein
MSGYQHNHRSMRLGPIALLVAMFLASTTGHAQEAEPGFFGKLFGGGDIDAGAHHSSVNIAWKAQLPPGLYDGDYSTCVAVSGAQRLEVGSTVTAHFDLPARITGATVYVRRLSEEGDVSGKFLDEGFFWNSSLGKVSQLGTNASAGISIGSPSTTSDIQFEITEVSAADTNVCLTELDVYGSFEEEEDVPDRKTGLEGNWIVEYSDADTVRNEVSFGYYTIWPAEDAATTGLWNYSTCGVPGSSGCASGLFTVSPEGQIQHQHPYRFKGLWGAFSTAKQVGPDELRGRWHYQEAYGGAEVWRRARPQVSRVVLSSDVADDFDPGKRPGRVEKTYDGYWWSSASDMRANRPSFHITFYGKNLWGHHDIRITPRIDTDDLVQSDLEVRCCGEVHGAGRVVVGLRVEVLAWAGAVPGRKTLYVDDIAIPFDFLVHGHPQENDVIWPEDATTPEDLKDLPPKIEFVSVDKDQKVLTNVPVGIAFRIRLTFGNSHDEASLPVTLRARLSGISVETEALSTNDPKIYLSEPIVSYPGRKWYGGSPDTLVSE